MRKAVFISLVLLVIGASASYSAYSLSSTTKTNTTLTTGNKLSTNTSNSLPANKNKKASTAKDSGGATKTNRHNQPATALSLVFDQYGFMPNQFSVPLGTKVTVWNKSASPLLFQALPGQPNQLNDMNLGTIEAGGSSSFVVSKLGSWQFQANNNPALRGNITATPDSKSTASLSKIELPQYDPQTHSLLINYTDYGFVPNMVSVPSGTKITIMNSTNEGGMDLAEMSTDSSQDPALSQGIIEKGQTASFTLNQPGTYHYINTWETTDMGQITVE